MLASCSLKGADSSESLKMGSTSSGEPPGNMTSVICRLPSSISGSRCRQAAMSRTLAASTGAAAVWCSAESWSAAIFRLQCWAADHLCCSVPADATIPSFA